MRPRAGAFQLDCDCVRQTLLVASCPLHESGQRRRPNTNSAWSVRRWRCAAPWPGTTVATNLTRDFAPPLIAEIETGSCAGSTPIGTSPFTAKARPGRDAGAQTEHVHSQFATRRRHSQGFVAGFAALGGNRSKSGGRPGPQC